MKTLQGNIEGFRGNVLPSLFSHKINYTSLRHSVSLYLSFLICKMKSSHFISDVMSCYCDVA